MASASPSASAAVVLAVGTQVERARLFGDAAVERDVRRLAERRPAVAGDGDEARAQPLDRLEQAQQLLRLAAVRQRDDHVFRLDDAEVAVRGFGRVEEEGGRAGARQRRRNLAADDPRLAHAGDDHAAAALEQQPHRLLEALVEALDEREDRGRFRLQHLARERDVSGGEPVSPRPARADPERVEGSRRAVAA